MKTLVFAGVVVLSLTACNQNQNFSLLDSLATFQQSAATVNDKIDILWVVDNSGSMSPLQTNLVNNFQSFMTTFQSKGFDYHLSVTTTDAYKSAANYSNNANLAKFRDGVGTTHSGVFTITPSIMDPVSTFVTNATQGSSGAGDERAFSSLLASLNSPLNTGFVRPGAFLGVVILSDEDDFSSNTRVEGDDDHDYNNPTLWTVDSVVSQLDALTASTDSARNYNVSAITVLDDTCRAAHAVAASSTIIGKRYIQLANATNGTLGSVCDTSYASVLNYIQQKIVELATSFKLTEIPDPSTLVITVGGNLVARNDTNGWSYDASANSITFHGTAVPSASASIKVAFTPTTLR